MLRQLVHGLCKDDVTGQELVKACWASATASFSALVSVFVSDSLTLGLLRLKLLFWSLSGSTLRYQHAISLHMNKRRWGSTCKNVKMVGECK